MLIASWTSMFFFIYTTCTWDIVGSFQIPQYIILLWRISFSNIGWSALQIGLANTSSHFPQKYSLFIIKCSERIHGSFVSLVGDLRAHPIVMYLISCCEYSQYPSQTLQNRLLKNGNQKFNEVILLLSCLSITHKFLPGLRQFFRESAGIPYIFACLIQYWSLFTLQWSSRCENTLHNNWYWSSAVGNCSK